MKRRKRSDTKQRPDQSRQPASREELTTRAQELLAELKARIGYLDLGKFENEMDLLHEESKGLGNLVGQLYCIEDKGLLNDEAYYAIEMGITRLFGAVQNRVKEFVRQWEALPSSDLVHAANRVLISEGPEAFLTAWEERIRRQPPILVPGGVSRARP